MCVVARLFRNTSELLLVVLVLPEHHYCFESTHQALWIQRYPVTPVHMEVSDEMLLCSVTAVSWQFVLSIFKSAHSIFP
jgi:hypothetical protein